MLKPVLEATLKLASNATSYSQTNLLKKDLVTFCSVADYNEAFKREKSYKMYNFQMMQSNILQRLV